MFGVAETFATGGRQAQIELLYIFIAGQVGGRAVHDYASVFQNVAIVGMTQGDVGILLGQQDASFLVLLEPAQDTEYFVDDLRRKAHPRFVGPEQSQ